MGTYITQNVLTDFERDDGGAGSNQNGRSWILLWKDQGQMEPCRSLCLECCCNNMQAVSGLNEVLNGGWGGGGRSQENKRNNDGKNYREDIFADFYLRKPGGWEEKNQFPTISKLIKGLQFISV